MFHAPTNGLFWARAGAANPSAAMPINPMVCNRIPDLLPPLRIRD
jgi:hypothetical protein